MRRALPGLMGAALFAVAAWTLVRAAERIGFAGLAASFSAVPRPLLAGAVVVTALNYFVLTIQELLAVAYAGVRLPARHVALASFVGYAVSNNVGFAMVSGTSARYRFYARWGLTTGDLSRVVLFYSTTFWLGVALVGGTALVVAPPPGLLEIVPRGIATIVGGIGIAASVAYVAVCAARRRPFRVKRIAIDVPPMRSVVMQVAISVADWVLAPLVLFLLLPAPRPDFLIVVAAFVSAQALGLVSHVPGGLGVFEGSMVLLLSPIVPAAALLPALALYRAVYYLAPLGVALAVLLIDESIQRRQLLSRWSRACRVVAMWAAPRGLAIFTFVSGCVLLISGATPSDPGRVVWLARSMPLALVEASHFVASLAGLLLLLLAQAIARRVDAAFYVTATALAVGVAGSLLKGGDYEEAAILTLVFMALVAGRRHFTRRARMFADVVSPRWLAAVGVVLAASTWLGFFAYRHVAYSSAMWWQFAFDADAPRFLRASVAVMTVALVIGLRQLLHPAAAAASGPDRRSMTEVGRVIALQPHTTAYLAYLSDKSFLWSDCRNAFVMYAVHGRSCIALGDAVGPRAEGRDLIGRFIAMASERDLTPVFYQVSAERLTDYIDRGLAVVKIGEEARVPLATFTLSGSHFKGLRAAVNHAEREGVTFRVAGPSEIPSMLAELQEVSDEWLTLKGVTEKGFSMGVFDPDYLCRFPIGLLERGGRIEAFANIWRGPGGVELSPDLMRHRITSPNGVMDVLFVSLMRWGRAQGYEWFNLGVAPLSGMRPSPVGHAWLQVARFIYGHGESLYNFRGLRAYKDKFDPAWEPRYLVYPGNLVLPRVLAGVAALVAGGYRQIFIRTARGVA